MGMVKNDLIMKVQFCDKHKKYFISKVIVKLSNSEIGINPIYLCDLIKESENCFECRWHTTFPTLKDL